MDNLNDIITPEMIQVAGVTGVALFLLILGFLSAFFMLIRRSFNANSENQKNMIENQSRNNDNMQRFFNGFVDILNTQQSSIIEALKELKGKTIIDKDILYQIYTQYAVNHANKKVSYVKKILEFNNIHKREAIIKVNIESKFREYTQKEICFFKKLNSDFGNLGALFSRWIDSIWDDAMEGTYKIVFSDSTIEQKLSDLKNLIDGSLSDFWDNNIK